MWDGGPERARTKDLRASAHSGSPEARVPSSSSQVFLSLFTPWLCTRDLTAPHGRQCIQISAGPGASFPSNQGRRASPAHFPEGREATRCPSGRRWSGTILTARWAWGQTQGSGRHQGPAVTEPCLLCFPSCECSLQEGCSTGSTAGAPGLSPATAAMAIWKACHPASRGHLKNHASLLSPIQADGPCSLPSSCALPVLLGEPLLSVAHPCPLPGVGNSEAEAQIQGRLPDACMCTAPGRAQAAKDTEAQSSEGMAACEGLTGPAWRSAGPGRTPGLAP